MAPVEPHMALLFALATLRLRLAEDFLERPDFAEEHVG